jgi:sulfur carrier protein ThiS
MKLSVKIYGTLQQQVPGYQHSKGIEVELADGATARDLLTRLKISDKQMAVIVMDGQILKENDAMREGAPIHLLQPVSGG